MQQRAGLHLDPAASFVASLPPLLVLALLLLIFVGLAISLSTVARSHFSAQNVPQGHALSPATELDLQHVLRITQDELANQRRHAAAAELELAASKAAAPLGDVMEKAKWEAERVGLNDKIDALTQQA